MTQTQFDAMTPIKDADLTPIIDHEHDVPQAAAGWQLDLQRRTARRCSPKRARSTTQ